MSPGTPERSALLNKVAELVTLGRLSGYTRADLVRMIEAPQLGCHGDGRLRPPRGGEAESVKQPAHCR